MDGPTQIKYSPNNQEVITQAVIEAKEWIREGNFMVLKSFVFQSI